jgi:hypothetical protein
MTIDPDLTVSELLAAWRLGEREQVLDILAGDHPGLAALFLSQVAREIGLGLTAFNTAVNGLIDRRVEAVKKQDRNAEFLPVVLHRVLVQSGWTPPQRMVYVSCNPATLARDAGLLVNLAGYRCTAASAVNMFPHTAHVESIAVFERP